MPEFRKDPLFDRWVVIAPERANRPFEIQNATPSETAYDDPFAEGNESATPPETLAYRNPGLPPNGPGWRVRVIPNRFPAVQSKESLDSRTEGLDSYTNGLYVAVDAYGIHEVIVECPHDESNLSRLSVENIRDVFTAYRDRMRDLKRNPQLAHITIFKNQGVVAGASVRHAHSQLIATPFVPPLIQEEMARARTHFDQHGYSIFQQIIEQELKSPVRVVLETEHFLVFCPYASRFGFETWVLPKRSRSHFEQLSPREIENLGTVMKTVLCKLELAHDNLPYNYVIHTAPVHAADQPSYSWYLEILPRISGVAGFEWGAGIHINTVPPEQAAATLRSL